MNKNTLILFAVLIGQYFSLCYVSNSTGNMKAGLMIFGALGCLTIFILARKIFPTPQVLVSFFNAYTVIYFISVVSVVAVYSNLAKPAPFAIAFMFALWYVLTYYAFPKKRTEEEIKNGKRLLYFNAACSLIGIIFASAIIFS